MDHLTALNPPLSRFRLAAEFLVLFIGVPMAMKAFFGLYSPLTVLAGLTVVTVWLLNRTPGFQWRELLRPPGPGSARMIAGFAAGTAVVVLALAWLLVPGQMFGLPTYRTELWLMIMILYPLISVLPQELIFRPLFFGRYGSLFPNRNLAILANGAAFALAHLFYANPVAIGLTFLGGMVMGWAYLRTGSFLTACILHTIGGQMIFTIGLGTFFYHGAVPA